MRAYFALPVVLAGFLTAVQPTALAAEAGPAPREERGVRDGRAFSRAYYVPDLVVIRVPESPRAAMDRTLRILQLECPATRGNLIGFPTPMAIVASLSEAGHAEFAAYLAEVRAVQAERAKVGEQTKRLDRALPGFEESVQRAVRFTNVQ